MRPVLFAALGATTFVAPAIAQWSFTRIADTNTPMPGSTLLFENLNAPSIRDGVVAFTGFNFSVNRRGAYSGSGGPLSVIADTTTPAPGGGTFSGFSLETGFAPSQHGGDVAFNAGSPSGAGVFLKSGTTFAQVLTSTMSVPNGGGVTFGLIREPSLEAGRVAITGGASLSGGPGGVYSWQSGTLSVVADHTTPIPGGPGTFTSISGGDLDQGSIIFTGAGAGGHRGLYRSDSGGLTRLYDSTMVVPGGNGGNFTTFSRAVLSDGRVAFYSQGGGTEGIYSDVSGSLQVVANRSTSMPGFPGLVFGGFNDAVIDRGVVGFGAIDNSGGRSGVFSTHTGALAKVLATGDLLDGRIVADVGLSAQAIEGQYMALWVSFSNGDYGVYMATIPAPPASLAFAAGLLWSTRRRRSA